MYYAKFNIENVLNKGCLSIGELIEKLQRYPHDKTLMLSEDTYFSGDYGSDRGDYEVVFIGESRDNKLSKVNDLLKYLEQFKSEKIMIGYKGGQYPVDDNTLIRVGFYGCSGRDICNVVEVDDIVYIVTCE